MDESLFKKFINLMDQTDGIDLTEDAILTKPKHTEFLISNHTANKRIQLLDNANRFNSEYDLSLPIGMINNYVCECCGKVLIFERHYNSLLCQACNERLSPDNSIYIINKIIYDTIIKGLSLKSEGRTDLSG